MREPGDGLSQAADRAGLVAHRADGHLGGHPALPSARRSAAASGAWLLDKVTVTVPLAAVSAENRARRR